MAFVFGLQSYLDIKQKIEKQKETEYGKAMMRLNSAASELERILDSIKKNIIEMKNEIRDSFSPAAAGSRRMYIRNLENRAEKQKKVVLELQEEAEKKRLELVEAVKDRKMLEKLREKAEEEFNIEQNRKAQLVTDEIISYKNSRRRKNG